MGVEVRDHVGVCGGEVVRADQAAEPRRVHDRPHRLVAPFTVLGWTVPDIDTAITQLASRGVAFQRYDGVDHDELGAWTAPGGAQVAWFHDPDGNTLSLTQPPSS